MGDDGFSNATHDVAEVGLVAKTLLGNDLNDALRKQTLALGQLRSAVAVKLSTTGTNCRRTSEACRRTSGMLNCT